MNICVFMGRLTAEPELRMTPNNVMVATFTLAVERKRTKGKAATDFFDVVAWRERGEFASKYLHKGQRVVVQGEMLTRSYTDRNGVKRKAYELTAASRRRPKRRSTSCRWTQESTMTAKCRGIRPKGA